MRLRAILLVMMGKKLFSLLAVLFVAATAFATFVIIKKDGTLVRINTDQLNFEQDGTVFKLNGVDVKDISNVFNKTWNKFDDYERAFTQEYLPSNYYAYPRNQQVTSLQFKELLKDIVEKFAPDSLPYYSSRISDYDIPITRGMAAMMAYYAARCIGATATNSRSKYSMNEHFWDDFWGPSIDQLFPYAQTPTPDLPFERPEGATALLWNDSHVSLYTNKEVIEYVNGTEGYAWGKPLIWEDAVRAVSRLYDNAEKTKPKIVYVSLDDPRAIKPDSTVITPELLAVASRSEVKSIVDLPRLYGLPMGPEHRPGMEAETGFDDTGVDVRRIALWGFNSISFRMSYLHLFTPDLQANLNMLRALDELIAVSMEYGVHFNLMLTDIPGRGVELPEHVQDEYIPDSDIQNPEKRSKDRKIWNVLATRYKDVPNRYLSFTTIANLSMSGIHNERFGNGQSFTDDELIEFQDFLYNCVREIDPDRFIFYDMIASPLPFAGLFEDLAKELIPQFEHSAKTYTNALPIVNMMDMPFGYYSYNNGDGNIDYAQHSNWVPQYPVTLYDTDREIVKGEELLFDGCLPKGTKFELFLASAAGKVTAIVDGTKVYEEDFGDVQHFKVGYFPSFGHPYAKSDKSIVFELEKDAKQVTIIPETGKFEWSGIGVTLPESYSVQKWRHDEQWDVELGILKPEEYHSEFYQRTTATVEVAPTGLEGRKITINGDVTYTSDYIRMASNEEVYDQYCSILTKMFGRWAQRVEDILFSDYESNIRYHGDIAKIYQKHHVDVWLPIDGYLFEEKAAPYKIAGYKGEEFEGYSNFNLELLRTLQKYQDK